MRCTVVVAMTGDTSKANGQQCVCSVVGQAIALGSAFQILIVQFHRIKYYNKDKQSRAVETT